MAAVIIKEIFQTESEEFEYYNTVFAFSPELAHSWYLGISS
jgi:hypothetical protein